MEQGSVLGRFEVLRPLGAGGMATVYAVRNVELGSIHALKVLLVDRPGLAERLLAEGRLQATLRHPHIVAVHDVTEVDGKPALLMELVEGMALDEWIEVHPDAAHETRLELARQILAAVGHAHQRGMVHRDLKPGNVLVTEVAGRPFAKVADFGLAKLLDDDVGRTRTGVPMGTPRYMAPEQIKDAKHVDARADVFALGCLLHELWTGAPAFAAESLPELFMDIAAGEMPDLEELPATVASAVSGALITDREARIQSCEELLEVLEGRREAPVAPVPMVEGAAPAGLAVAGAGVAGLLGGVALVIALLCGGGGLWWLASDGSNDPRPGGPVAEPDPGASPEPAPGTRPRPAPTRPSPSPRPDPSPPPAPEPDPEPKPKPPGKDKEKPGKGKGRDK